MPEDLPYQRQVALAINLTSVLYRTVA